MRTNLEGGGLGVLCKRLEEEEVGAPLVLSSFPGRGQGWGWKVPVEGSVGLWL